MAILRLWDKVTFETLKEVTRGKVAGGDKFFERGWVKTISLVLEELRLRLLVVAKELMWFSSRGVDKELEDGTKR